MSWPVAGTFYLENNMIYIYFMYHRKGRLTCISWLVAGTQSLETIWLISLYFRYPGSGRLTYMSWLVAGTHLLVTAGYLHYILIRLTIGACKSSKSLISSDLNMKFFCSCLIFSFLYISPHPLFLLISLVQSCYLYFYISILSYLISNNFRN